MSKNVEDHPAPRESQETRSFWVAAGAEQENRQGRQFYLQGAPPPEEAPDWPATQEYIGRLIASSMFPLADGTSRVVRMYEIAQLDAVVMEAPAAPSAAFDDVRSQGAPLLLEAPPTRHVKYIGMPTALIREAARTLGLADEQ